MSVVPSERAVAKITAPSVKGVLASQGAKVFAYFFFCAFSSLGLVGKAELLKANLHVPKVALMALAISGLFLGLAWPLALKFRKVLGPLFLAGILAASFLAFPKFEKLHAQGRGTDQPDCVIVASQGMLAGQWPYQRERMWSKGPMSCGPGWVAMQAPVVDLLGYSFALSLLWLGSVFALAKAFGWDRTSGILSLLALCPGLWLAAANGTDFLPFGICIAALAVAAQSLKGINWLFAVICGLVVQFRFPTVLLPGLLTKSSNRTSLWIATGIGILTQVLFLIWNPKSYLADGPISILRKVADTGLGSGYLLPILVTCGCVAAAILTNWIGKRYGGTGAVLAFLLLAFFAPAVLNLFRALRTHTGLERWEGGMWAVACLPIITIMLVNHLSESSSLAGVSRKKELASG